MPQIPTMGAPELQRTGGMVQSQAVGQNFGVLDYSVLGDNLRRTGQIIQEGASDYLRAERKAQDNDLAQKINLNEAEGQATYEARCKDNPNDYESFAKWHEEYRANVEKLNKPLYEKMSESGRKECEYAQKMRGIQVKAWQGDITRNAKVTAMYNDLGNSVERYTNLRDEAGADYAIQSAIDTQIISPENGEKMRMKLKNDISFLNLRDQLEGGNTEIITNLKKKSEAGTYSDYAELSEQNRNQLIKYGEQLKNRKESETQAQIMYAIQTGEPVKPEEIETMKESGVLSPESATAVLRTLDHVKAREEALANDTAYHSFNADMLSGNIPDEKAIETSYTNGDINLQERNRRVEHLRAYNNAKTDTEKREVQARIKAQDWAAKKEEERKQAQYKTEGDFIRWNMLEAYQAGTMDNKQKIAFQNQIMEHYAFNPDGAKKALSELESYAPKIDQVTGKEVPGRVPKKDSYAYKMGVGFVKNAELIYKPGFWTSGTEDSTDFQERRRAELFALYDDWFEANPNATPDEVGNWIDNQVKKLNDGAITNYLDQHEAANKTIE